tara:strand:+ start:4977 stop:5639 length:663 start_codon:yes stop_codon:yes gene_type:complete
MARKRAEVAFQTRTRLLTATAKLIAKNGYDATSVEDIAAEAGYTHGAIYRHFDSKETLFLESVSAYIGPRLTLLFERLESIQSLDEQVAYLAHHFYERSEKDPDWILLENEFWLFAMRRPHLRPQVEELYGKLRPFYTIFELPEWRRRARRLGVETGDLISIISAMIDGLTRQQYATPDDVDLEFVQMSLRAILGMRRTVPAHLQPDSDQSAGADQSAKE